MIPSNNTIWVIVPVYNVQKWLKKCVHSIQRQTYTNWKAILVDDGSTDRSGEICDELAKKDDRLVVLHTPNSGAHQARVNGILAADDDCYAMFCDSDDELAPNALELLHAEAVRSGAELVCGGTQRILKQIRLPQKDSMFIMNPRCYNRQQIMSELFVSCLGLGGFPVSLCSKLYHSSMLKRVMANLGESPKLFAEDLNVTLHLLPEVNRISAISQVVYRYRYGGGTSRFMPTFLEDNLLMYHTKMKYAHLCTSEYDVEALIAIELKNIIGTYLVMCEKFHTFPHGTLLNEVRYICELEEVCDAMGRFHNDKSGIAGLGDAVRSKDAHVICSLIQEQVQRTQKQDFIKNLLFR